MGISRKNIIVSKLINRKIEVIKRIKQLNICTLLRVVNVFIERDIIIYERRGKGRISGDDKIWG